MRLKRGTAIYAFPSHSSEGAWNSADGRWLFFHSNALDANPGPRRWVILAALCPLGYEGLRKRNILLKQTGLADARFKTRREAVAALELALASASGSEALQ